MFKAITYLAATAAMIVVFATGCSAVETALGVPINRSVYAPPSAGERPEYDTSAPLPGFSIEAGTPSSSVQGLLARTRPVPFISHSTALSDGSVMTCYSQPPIHTLVTFKGGRVVNVLRYERDATTRPAK